MNPDALDIADELDMEREAGKVRGPLHGIPFLVKDVSSFYLATIIITICFSFVLTLIDL